MATYDLAYPGAAIDAILNTAYFLQEAGYIFQGSASEYSGTPSKRVWLIAPAGFTGLGLSSAVPQGSFGICLYNGTAWVGKVINVLTLDSAPTRNSQNGVTSGGVAATLDEIAGGIMETFASLLFDDETASADLRTKLSYAVKFSVSDVYQTVTHLNILAATTSKAGLMSAEDKAKVDSFLTNLRSLTFTDTTASADQGTKITETLKATIGGVQEVIDSITLLAATSSKAGLLSASDKAYIDALPATLTSLSNSISGALALMQSLVGYYVCDTAAGTSAKTVDATGYSLTNGGCIRIKMINANTANSVTLNINSTGAKALYYDGTQASSNNSWEAGDVLEVYYDGTQYQCASGGGGKFATGERVKDVGITNQIENNDKLITSGAVYGLTDDSTIDLSQLTSQVCSLGTNTWYRNGSSGPQRHIALPVIAGQKIILSASITPAQDNFYTYYAWCTSSYSPPYSSGQSVPMVAGETSRIQITTGASPIVITAPDDAAYLVMTTVDGGGVPITWTAKHYAKLNFKTGEKVCDVGITNSLEQGADDELLTKQAMSDVLYGTEPFTETLTPTEVSMQGNDRLRIDYVDKIKNGDAISFVGNGYEAYIGVVNSAGTSWEEVISDYTTSFEGVYMLGNSRRFRFLVRKVGGANFSKDDALNNITYSLTREITGGNGVIPKIDDLSAKLGYYTCTSGAAYKKEVAAQGYVLSNGGCIRIKMINANTMDNVTLNINNTGEKALFYNGSQASSTNSWEAGEVLEIYYDGTQYQCQGVSPALLETVRQLDYEVYGSPSEITADWGDWKSSNTNPQRIYVICNDKTVLGGIVKVKLNNYNTYKTGIVIQNGTGWITSGSIFDDGWHTADCTHVVAENEVGYNIRVSIARNDNGAISPSEAQNIISLLEYKYGGRGMSIISRLEDLENAELNLPKTIPMEVLPGAFYVGEKMDLGSHSFSSEVIGSFANAGNYVQGAAVFGDYLFQFHNTNNAVIIIKLSTGQTVQTIQFTPNANCHCNTASFGSQYYDTNDPFPCVYVSSEGEKKVYVYRITGTEGNYAMTVVQELSHSLPYYYPNISIDAPNNRGIAVGYKINSWQNPEGNAMLCCCFDLPDVKAGNKSLENPYNEFTFPFIYAQQTAFGKYGKLYHVFGNTSDGLRIGGIIVIDYILHNVITFVDLHTVGNFEPEGLGEWDGGLVITTQGRQIIKLTF